MSDEQSQVKMPSVTIEFWLPGSFDEPKGSYFFEYLWTEPFVPGASPRKKRSYLKDAQYQNAIHVMKKLIHSVPMGSYFGILYKCPFTGALTEQHFDRKSVVPFLESLADSVILNSPLF